MDGETLGVSPFFVVSGACRQERRGGGRRSAVGGRRKILEDLERFAEICRPNAITVAKDVFEKT